MRRRLVITAVPGSTDYVLRGWKADKVIEESGRGPVWSRLHEGWLLYAGDVRDVVATAEYMRVNISGELPPIPKPAPVVAARVDSQLALFDGSR